MADEQSFGGLLLPRSPLLGLQAGQGIRGGCLLGELLTLPVAGSDHLAVDQDVTGENAVMRRAAFDVRSVDRSHPVFLLVELLETRFVVPQLTGVRPADQLAQDESARGFETAGQVDRCQNRFEGIAQRARASAAATDLVPWRNRAALSDAERRGRRRQRRLAHIADLHLGELTLGVFG